MRQRADRHLGLTMERPDRVVVLRKKLCSFEDMLIEHHVRRVDHLWRIPGPIQCVR